MSYTCAFCIRTPTNFFVSTCTETRWISLPGRGPPQENAAEYSTTLATGRTRRNPDRQVLSVDLSTTGTDRYSPHLGSVLPDQEIRGGGGRRRLCRRSRHRCA